MATIQHETRDEWLAARKEFIGASEAPIVLGVSPYCSPLKLWSQKTGRIEPDEENKQMRRGTRLEPVVADMVAEETGWTLRDDGRYTVRIHSELEWMGCTLDRIIEPVDERGPGNLQIKTASAFAAHEWDSGIPLHVAVQVQHELAVTGFSWGAVAVLIGGDDLKLLAFERNERFINAMIGREYDFMRCLWEDMPPPVDGSEATAEALKKLYPHCTGASVDLPADAAAWDEKLSAVKTDLKRLESEKMELENLIKSAIGEAAYGVLPNGGRYAWLTRQRQYEARAAYTVEYRELRRLKA